MRKAISSSRRHIKVRHAKRNELGGGQGNQRLRKKASLQTFLTAISLLVHQNVFDGAGNSKLKSGPGDITRESSNPSKVSK